MKLFPYFSFGSVSKFATMLVFLTSGGILFACQPLSTIPTSKSPTVEFIISTPSFLTETPIPACVVLSDIELSVDLLSESSFHIRITGLIPNENVHAIFNSKIRERELETIASGEANEEGVFEYSHGWQDTKFKDWQIRVVHSRGSTCAEVSLP